MAFHRPLNTRGFTLMELVVVVAVIGILAVLSIPTFLGYWRTATLKAGSQELVALLNQGRQVAIKENSSVCMRVEVAPPNFGTRLRYIVKGTDCAATATCASNGNVTPCFWTGPGTDASGWVQLSNRVEIRRLTPGTGDMEFSYLGAAPITGSFRVRMMDNTSATSTVSVASSGRTSYVFP